MRQVQAISPTKFNWVGVYLLRGDVLELGPFAGAATDHVRIPVGRGVCGTAVAENRDQNVPDVRERPNYLACSLETRSELVVLVRRGGVETGEIVAQIDIDSHVVGAFGSEEERAVRGVAKDLGAAWPG